MGQRLGVIEVHATSAVVFHVAAIALEAAGLRLTHPHLLVSLCLPFLPHRRRVKASKRLCHIMILSVQPSIPATHKKGKGKQDTMPHYDIVNQKRRIILTSQSMMWKRCQQTIYTEMRPNSLRTLKLSDFQSSFIKYSLCKCESRD